MSLSITPRYITLGLCLVAGLSSWLYLYKGKGAQPSESLVHAVSVTPSSRKPSERFVSDASKIAQQIDVTFRTDSTISFPGAGSDGATTIMQEFSLRHHVYTSSCDHVPVLIASLKGFEDPLCMIFIPVIPRDENWFMFKLNGEPIAQGNDLKLALLKPWVLVLARDETPLGLLHPKELGNLESLGRMLLTQHQQFVIPLSAPVRTKTIPDGFTRTEHFGQLYSYKQHHDRVTRSRVLAQSSFMEPRTEMTLIVEERAITAREITYRDEDTDAKPLAKNELHFQFENLARELPMDLLATYSEWDLAKPFMVQDEQRLLRANAVEMTKGLTVGKLLDEAKSSHRMQQGSQRTSFKDDFYLRLKHFLLLNEDKISVFLTELKKAPVDSMFVNDVLTALRAGGTPAMQGALLALMEDQDLSQELKRLVILNTGLVKVPTDDVVAKYEELLSEPQGQELDTTVRLLSGQIAKRRDDAAASLLLPLQKELEQYAAAPQLVKSDPRHRWAFESSLAAFGNAGYRPELVLSACESLDQEEGILSQCLLSLRQTTDERLYLIYKKL